MLELAADIGVEFCAVPAGFIGEFAGLPVEDANYSFKGLLIQLIANTKELHDRS